MEITHLTYSLSGGAGEVAKILHQEQLRQGFKSAILYSTDSNLRSDPLAHPIVTASATLDHLLVRNGQESGLISLNRQRVQTLDISKIPRDSVLHFHWVPGLLNITSISKFLASDRRVVWTLHDMSPFTSACHHSFDCKRLALGCSECPQVYKLFRPQVHSQAEKKRQMLIDSKNVKLIAPSNWMAKQALENKFIHESQIDVIGNPISDIFWKADSVVWQNSAQKEKTVFKICVVATDLGDPLKQVHLIVQQFNELRKQALEVDLQLYLIGSRGEKFSIEGEGIYNLGLLTQETMVNRLIEMDVLVSLSKKESAGLVVRELGALRVPSIVLAGSGISELVENNLSGFVSTERPLDLGRKILEYVKQPDLSKKHGDRAKQLSILTSRAEHVHERYLQEYENQSQ